MGMAARFSQHESLASTPPRERGRPFTKDAERLLNLHDASLTTIQACLLLGASAVVEGEGATESIYFSIACRMAMLLDLPNAPTSTRIQQELNYRGWNSFKPALSKCKLTRILSVVGDIRDRHLVVYLRSIAENDTLQKCTAAHGREEISQALAQGTTY